VNTFFPRLAAAVLLTLAAAAAGRAGGKAATSLEARRETIKQEVMPKVAELRGLSFTADVPIRAVTQSDVASYVRKAIEEDMTPEEFEGYQRVLVYLGLLRAGTDLRETVINTYSQQIAGYYDDEKKYFAIVERDSTPAALDSMTVAHELTHALQDEHFDLKAMRKMVEHDDDAGLAVMALAEGDASDIMLRFATKSYARGKGQVKDYTPFLSVSLGAQSIPDLPMILAQDMIFPYTYGTRFATAVMKRAGDGALDRAFADPPVSTEQVMNPDKYLRRDEPFMIEIADLSGKLGKGWRQIDSEPLGQFNLGIYLSSNLGAYGIEDLIEPWKGDTLAAYSGPDGELFLIYYSTWDTPQAAANFAAGYRRLLETRFGDLERARSDTDLATWLRGKRLYYVKRVGSDVVVVENVPREVAGDAILGAWDAPKVPLNQVLPLADRDRIQPGAKENPLP